jgi:hypothetical protein
MAIPEQTPQAILVPGGGLTDQGELPAWVRARFETALQNAGKDSIFILLSGGTVYKPPPLDDRGFPLYESLVGARFLAARGIAKNRILTEKSSYDTIGNAYFSRMIHVEPAGLETLLIVTSEFHLARTREIFNWVYSLVPRPAAYQCRFQGAPDQGLPPDILRARQQKEQKSLQRVKQLRQSLTRLDAFHRWMFTEHNAYNQSGKPAELPAQLKSTY